MKYDGRFISVDVETGGLPDVLKKRAVFEVALTEIALVAIDIEKLQIVDKYSCLIKPYSNNLIYQQQALDVSNISLDLLDRKGIDMKEAFKNVSEFVSNQFIGKKKPRLVGHNIIKFDMEFIQNLWEMNKVPVDKHWDTLDIWDTMLVSRTKFIEGSMALSAVIERLGFENKQAHRALQDATITAEVFINFVKCLRGEGQGAKKEKRFRDTFQF